MRSFQKSQITFFKTKTNFLNIFFVPVVIMEWDEIDYNIRNSVSSFYESYSKFIRLESNEVFNVESSAGLKFLTRIRH